jgi:hypothetical protein
MAHSLRGNDATGLKGNDDYKELAAVANAIINVKSE